MCGENRAFPSTTCRRTGSPPRVRGKQPREWPHACRPGITPACAGKTAKLCSLAFNPWDHPRVCGENAHSSSSPFSTSGSPPRVRGKLIDAAIGLVVTGITPACAGKTNSALSMSLRNRDHPRVCGENEIKFTENEDGEGSPPRVRGKHKVTWETFGKEGITPACAGKTNPAGK